MVNGVDRTLFTPASPLCDSVTPLGKKSSKSTEIVQNCNDYSLVVLSLVYHVEFQRIPFAFYCGFSWVMPMALLQRVFDSYIENDRALGPFYNKSMALGFEYCVFRIIGTL
eukprot:Gb_06768 [translate_table: standard]